MIISSSSGGGSGTGSSSNRNHYNSISSDDVEQQQSISSSSSSSSIEKIGRKIGLIVGVILILSVLIVTNPTYKNTTITNLDKDITPFTSISTSSSSTNSNDMTITLYRTGYNALDYFTVKIGWKSTILYKHLENYVAVIEPSSPMSLYVKDSKEEDGYKYYYKICKYSTTTGKKSKCSKVGEVSSTREKTITTSCSPYDEYYVYVEEYNSDKVLERSAEGQVLCQYVRREIRSLTSDDLDKAMDAMYTLWSVSEEDGQVLYGDKYHSATYFTEAHTFNAGQQDSDHIHEGLGFLPQHIKMTNMFEESVQQVDPSFSLPYWDFTIDTEEGLGLAESPMFTADTFGSIQFPKDDTWGWTYRDDSIEGAAIPDGRWKKQLADINSRYSFPGNSFGFMRGPWNLNPSPYISRFSISNSLLPQCSSYYSWLEETSLESFLNIAPFGPHASVHGAVGAVFGCDVMDQMRENGSIPDEDSQRSICKKWGFILKELYRANTLFALSSTECSYTSLTYEGISCGYSCPTDEDSLETMSSALKAQLRPFDVDTSDENMALWIDFVCSGDGYRIFVGDHLESASPSDPSFWPVHANQERLLHLKYVSGGFADAEWPTSAKEVCEKHTCYESKYGAKKSYDQCCYGHYENDQLLDFVNGDAEAGYGLTNKEIMEGTDSSSASYSMTYIYDDYTWTHCMTKDFLTLSEELFTTILNSTLTSTETRK